ncbi:hypothetical protein FIT78_00655 [Candidatus Methylopumilus universalis]|uniref:hypothetical protein n=1 Tax=Candidatus Methylopumilus universalis TaxID=2588536 RepID=UPI00111F9067|nr:hypothetical protein [Candidatus Methylopumilus universalis]QDC97154.1 hypothetical protein FIT78_00655 [Candidatus Methylopumilus universalis]
MKKLLNQFDRVSYKKLNDKMQEAYNFQKASAVLADYGFVTNLLKYDWQSADFLAQHQSGKWLKIQLKGRLTCSPKYYGDDLYIMFQDKDDKNMPWYLFPHDDFMNEVKKLKPNSAGAIKGFSTGKISKEYKKWLANFLIS